jgi:hypothetical protein
MKNVNEKKIILNTELVRAVSENGQITLFIRMIDGKWAKQQPYSADLRGQIGALTLAIDALAGKIILTETVLLDDRDFEVPKPNTIEIPVPKMIGTLNSKF